MTIAARADHGRHHRRAPHGQAPPTGVRRAQPDHADRAPDRPLNTSRPRSRLWVDPAGLADDILGQAGDRVSWRRLFTAGRHSREMIVVGTDRPPVHRLARQTPQASRRRHLPRAVCGAPSATRPHHLLRRRTHHLRQRRGVCERHNQVRELSGWTVETLRLGRHGRPQLIATTTPTGHTYLSRAPNPPDPMSSEAAVSATTKRYSGSPSAPRSRRPRKPAPRPDSCVDSADPGVSRCRGDQPLDAGVLGRSEHGGQVDAGRHVREGEQSEQGQNGQSARCRVGQQRSRGV